MRDIHIGPQTARDYDRISVFREPPKCADLHHPSKITNDTHSAQNDATVGECRNANKSLRLCQFTELSRLSLAIHLIGLSPGARIITRQVAVTKRVLTQFDLDIYTCGKIEFHQRIYGLVGWINDIHNPFMGTNLVLIPGVFVYMGGD